MSKDRTAEIVTEAVQGLSEATAMAENQIIQEFTAGDLQSPNIRVSHSNSDGRTLQERLREAPDVHWRERYGTFKAVASEAADRLDALERGAGLALQWSEQFLEGCGPGQYPELRGIVARLREAIPAEKTP